MLRLFNKIRWGKLVKAALVGAGLFFIAGQLLYMLLLHAGPSVETVRQKAAAVMGVPPSELVYVGGHLRRESSVLFHHEGEMPFTGDHVEIPPDGQNFETILNFLKGMNVTVDKDATIKVFKFPMEFDTVFCVVCGKERWIVFYGNIVM